MRALDPTWLASLGITPQTPGYLVEIDFSIVSRLSSMGDVSWNGYDWGSADIKVTGLAFGTSMTSNGGTLVLGNTMNVWGALVMGQKIADRRIRIWSAFRDGAGLAIVEQVFSGVGDETVIDPTADTVSISLVQQSTSVLYSPRRFCNAEAGFNHLTAAGAVIVWGGTSNVLDRSQT